MNKCSSCYWWKQCGERQIREVKEDQYQATQIYECRVIEQEEFISLIKQLTNRILADTLNET